jgi:hypothetical protein
MAENFRVCTKTSSNQALAVQLFGDFDGSSACELIQVLDQRLKTSTKVAIDNGVLHNFCDDGFYAAVKLGILTGPGWLQH